MEAPAEKVEVKKQTWKDHLSGEVYDDATDILYYKNTLKDEKYENLLLGDFNSEGNYSIDKVLLQELVEVNKYVTDKVDGTYFLSAKTTVSGEFDLKFILKFKKDEDQKRKIAILILTENFKSVDDQLTETLNTTIARYRDEDDIYFMQKVAKVFHIFDKTEDGGKEEENEKILIEFLKSKRRMKFLKGKLLETNNYLSKYYIDSVLAVLKANPGKFSEYVLRKYEGVLENLKDMVNKPNYYKLLRLELDKIVNSSKHMCDNPNILKQIADHKAVFCDSFNRYEENLIEPIMAAPKKEASPSKSGGGKSSGGVVKAKGGAKKAAVKKAAAPAKSKQAVKDNSQRYTPPELFINPSFNRNVQTKDNPLETKAPNKAMNDAEAREEILEDIINDFTKSTIAVTGYRSDYIDDMSNLTDTIISESENRLEAKPVQQEREQNL